MKKKKIRYLLTVICMLAAGICYSCGRTGKADPESQILTVELDTGEPEEGTKGENGLISAESEAGTQSAAEQEERVPEESPSRQTESVRFYVHICGEVRNPGVYQLEPGSRIFQAVEMAGGFTQEAAADCLNMAQETADGMKITVPSKEEADGEGTWIQMPNPAAGGTLGQQAPQQKINLNTAGKEELMSLKGIGEAKAESIIRYREEQGPFKSIEEVMNIPGIKEAAFQKIKDDITV